MDLKWRRDPPPRKEGEYILAIFYHDTDKIWERYRLYVVYWFQLRKDKDHKGVWVFADYEREDSIDDPVLWMPIEDLMKQNRINIMKMKWDVMETRTDPFKMFHPSQNGIVKKSANFAALRERTFEMC